MVDERVAPEKSFEEVISDQLTDLLILGVLIEEERLKRAVLNNHVILEYLVLVRLNQQLSIPRFVVKLWLADRVLLQDDRGVYINPVVEDLIDDALAVMAQSGLLERVRRDAEQRAQKLCKLLSR
jgi:hypothetical protein